MQIDAWSLDTKPAGQSLQVVLRASEYLPAMQGLHCVPFTARVPCGHGEQAGEPAPRTKPSGHGVQLDKSVASTRYPGGQARHAVPLEACVTGHTTQASSDGFGAVPNPHVVQLVLPTLDTLPLPHGKHLSPSKAYVPAEQARHTVSPNGRMEPASHATHCDKSSGLAT